MAAVTIAKTEEQDTVLFLDSDLTSQEWTERQADELAIEMAGKDRLEKALIIGEKLSHIYNSGSFRRSAPGGERWTWEDWVNKRLPELLPGEAPKIDAADRRRLLWEVRQLLSGATSPRQLPTAAEPARALQALIPRRYERPAGGWNPAILDDPDAAEGLRVVWGLALQNAAKQKRKSGPTTEDVRAAREEARPQLAAAGLIREAPAAFQQSTAERMAQAAVKRDRVVDITPEEQEEKDRRFSQIMDEVEEARPQREQQARVDAVKEELSRPERERLDRLQDKVRKYNSFLNAANSSVHELLVFLQTVDRVDGTQFLDDMRDFNVMGLITVKDDLPRLQKIGEDLMTAVGLARSCNPPTGIDMSTFTVEAE
jgi:hypothetical protein